MKEWTAGGWDDIETIQFIYEGWNVIEEYRLTASNTTLVRNYTWGTDLSGSLQGAGGVGGLLLAEEINGGITTAYHFHYDGNGNVTEITDLNGDSAASYRYDAFGNTLSGTGAYAAENRYRFSTKPLDSEVTNAPLYYYAYRYYDPVTGRWPSRDPIEEMGGLNLYGFVGNDGVNWWDLFGLCDDCDGKAKGAKKTEISNTRETVQGSTDEEWANIMLGNATILAGLQALGNVPTDAEDLLHLAMSTLITGPNLDGNAGVNMLRAYWELRQASKETFGTEISVDYKCYECSCCYVLWKEWKETSSGTYTSNPSKKKKATAKKDAEEAAKKKCK